MGMSQTFLCGWLFCVYLLQTGPCSGGILYETCACVPVRVHSYTQTRIHTDTHTPQQMIIFGKWGIRFIKNST